MEATATVVQPEIPEKRLAFAITPLRIMAALVVLACTMRLIHAGSRPMWLDEAYSDWFSSRSWTYLWQQVPTYEPHPPFYYSILKAWRLVAGDGMLAQRSLSVLFAGAAVPVVMAAAQLLEQSRPSGRPMLAMGLAGFLAACSPMFVLLGHEARPYPLLILAYAIAVLALLRLIRDFAAGGRGSWRSWLLLAGATETALWAHGLGLFYAAALAVALAPAWVAKPFDCARILRGCLTAAIVALGYAPCLLMMIGRAGDWGTGWLSWDPVMILQLLPLYSVPVEVLGFGSAIAALAMLLLAKRALQGAVQSKGWTPDRALAVLWLAPPIAAVLISFFFPIFLARALAPTLIPAYLLMGAALARVGSRRERLVLGCSVVILLIPTALQVALQPASERWDEVRAYLERHVQPGDEVWLYPNDSALPLRAAGPLHVKLKSIPGDYPATTLKGPVRAGSPAVVSVTARQAQALARDPTVNSVRTIWLVERQSKIFDPHDDLVRALLQVRRPGQLQQWGYITVRPFR